MKKKELNLLEKQRELEKKRDEQKSTYLNCVIGGIFFCVASLLFYFFLPQIVKGKADEAKFLKYQIHITLGFLAFGLFLLGWGFFVTSNQKKKTEQEIEKVKKELGE